MEKLSLTIGIPAHNEAGNIRAMINSVMRQKGNFVLEKIIVVLDGCTDNTEKIVRKMSMKYPLIHLIADGKRLGKARRLNQIHAINKSNFVGTFDADIVLSRTCELDIMVKVLLSNKKVNVVAARQIPVEDTSFIGRISSVSYMLWYETTSNVNGGNHIHNLHGSSSLLRKKFAKSFVYPKRVISDQGYLYMQATRNNKNGFYFTKHTKILFRTVSTLRDCRIQGSRAIYDDKVNLASFYGKRVYMKYHIPFKYKLTALLKMLFKEPIFTPLTFILGIYIRMFPYNDNFKRNGVWHMVASSKSKIKI